MFISFDLFFSLVNFGVLIGLGVYVYQKYGKSLLFEHMRSQEEALRLLQLEEVALQEEKERLKLIIEQEQRARLQLLEKITVWRREQDNEQQKVRQVEQEMQQALAKKVQAQAQWYAQHQLIKEVLPEVVAKAQDQLTQEFKIPLKQEHYIQDIVAFMKKRVS